MKAAKATLIYLTAAFFLIPNAAYAQLTVPTLKAYQVISRTSADKADISVSGTCKSGTAKITLTITRQDDNSIVPAFDGTDIAATFQTTSWNANLVDLPVGGEYVFHFHAFKTGDSADDSVRIEHILVGDVWLCAGQSNMLQVAPDNPDPEHVHVRMLFKGNGPIYGSVPDTSRWTNGNSTGPSITFGSEFYAQTGIPVGIILGASGNTSLTDWFDPPQRPLFTILKNLVLSTCGFSINGFFWYQGENEDQQDVWALSYFTKFIPLCDTVRALAKNDSLPVLAVQLESWDGGGKYALPVARWPRWPVIREGQEKIGAADPFSATVPAWDYAGLHIDRESQGALGKRAAVIAAGRWYGKSVGTGPLYDTAWFIDDSRTKVLVRLKNLSGKIQLPEDPDRLGFYLMKPSAFNINDQAIFDYGASDKMIVPLKSVTVQDSDKVMIELQSPVEDSLCVGYGRHINLITLDPCTDNSGIPLCTFFNRPIAHVPPVRAGHSTFGMHPGHTAALSVAGRHSGKTVVRYHHPVDAHIRIELFAPDGKSVAVLIDHAATGGSHEVSLGTNSGTRIGCGVYLCVMSIDNLRKECITVIHR